MTNEEVYEKLSILKNKFPSGAYWNHDPEYPNNPNSVTTIPCTHANHNCYTYDGSCGCNSFGGGIQCYGFALYMAYLTFNSYPSVGSTPLYTSNGGEYGEWKLYTQGYCKNLKLEPGDIIRKDNHSAIVLNTVTSADKRTSVIVGEVWSSYGCKICWGYFNGSDRYEDNILSGATYIVKAPKDFKVEKPTDETTKPNVAVSTIHDASYKKKIKEFLDIKFRRFKL